MNLQYKKENKPFNDSLLDLTHQAREILINASLPREVSDPELQWLDDRLDRWRKQTWDVGIIGITSSGKSTLLNALLGINVLPAHVAPTSNCLVCCGYGPVLEGIIYFEHKKQPEHISHDKNALKNRLAEVADERKNINNTLKVKEIYIRSPHYRLPENVFLYDTPGLDAYGLDQHERLTIEIFLPTVDAVIFITTAKANSDAIVRDRLDIIAKAEKPIIFVQNMIDAVEPKLGIGGLIEKTKEEVCKENLERMKRLVASCTYLFAQKASICQVSALKAVKGELAQSGVPEMCKLITDQLQKLLPMRRVGRFKQLHQHLRKLAWLLQPSKDPEIEARELQNEKDRLLELSKKLKSLHFYLESEGTKILQSAYQQGKELLFKVNNPWEFGIDYAHQIDYARKLIYELNQWKDTIAKSLHTAYKTTESKIKNIAKDLNLREEDYIPRIAPFQLSYSDSIPTFEKKTKTWVKAPGFWGWLKRLIGWGGYEEVEESEIVVDVEKFKNNVNYAVNEVILTLEDYLNIIEAKLNERINFLKKEISRQEQGLNIRAASLVDIEKRAAIVIKIAKLAQQARDLANSEKETELSQSSIFISREEKVTEFTANSLIIDIFKLANVAASTRFTAIRNLCVDRIRPNYNFCSSRLLVWGWDDSSLLSFRNRFFVDTPEIASLNGFKRLQGPEPFEETLFVDEGSSSASKIKKILPLRESMVFLLVDFQAPGETISQIMRSPVQKEIRHGFPFVLVAQSLMELRLCGPSELAEAFYEMKLRISQLGLQPIAVIANDDSIIMSDLIDFLFLNDVIINSKVTMQNIIKELGIIDTGNPEERLCQDILREWEYWSRKESKNAI